MTPSDGAVRRLEGDIQSLEQHLENMRFTYQLNQEKLQYNYSVLVERDAENQFTISQQKRKVAHHRDTLSTLKVSRPLHQFVPGLHTDTGSCGDPSAAMQSRRGSPYRASVLAKQ